MMCRLCKEQGKVSATVIVRRIVYNRPGGVLSEYDCASCLTHPKLQIKGEVPVSDYKYLNNMSREQKDLLQMLFSKYALGQNVTIQ